MRLIELKILIVAAGISASLFVALILSALLGLHQAIGVFGGGVVGMLVCSSMKEYAKKGGYYNHT